MEPIGTILFLNVARLVAAIDWADLVKSTLKTGVNEVGKNLWSHLKPGDQKKLAGIISRLFLEAFYEELRSTLNLAAAIPEFEKAVITFFETNLIEIVSIFESPLSEPDLSSLKRTWEASDLYALPVDFDWTVVGKRTSQGLVSALKADDKLRPLLEFYIHEHSSATLDSILKMTEAIAGPLPAFDVASYRQYLLAKANNLQLSLIHYTTYPYDKQVDVWSVFVAQSARASVPAPKLPRVVFRRLNEEGYLSRTLIDKELELLGKQFIMSPVRSVVKMADTETRLVVLGDPGSGKTALLNYLASRWCKEETGRLPLRIDLREYARSCQGFINFLSKHVSTFQLNASALVNLIESGAAVLQCDGLDEIFDVTVRASVIEELAAFSAKFPACAVLVTSRIIGYDPSRLRSSGFAHATLVDFDNSQILAFLSLWHATIEQNNEKRLFLQLRLEQAIKSNKGIRELAGNPLLLTMMAILNKTQDLPRNRSALYRDASRMLVHEWDTRRFLPDNILDHHDKETFLCVLAGHMQNAEGGLAGNLIGRSELIVLLRKFLDGLSVSDSYRMAHELVVQLTERNFILSFVGADRFAFVHRTFLEYYCALWFFDQLCVSKSLPAKSFRDTVLAIHVDDPAWSEVFCLLVGLVGTGDAECILRGMIDSCGDNGKRLVLSARCIAEIRNRNLVAQLDREILERLQDVVRSERYDFALAEVTLESGNIFPAYGKGLVILDAIRIMANAWRNEDTFAFLSALVEGDGRPILSTEVLSVIAREWAEVPETQALLVRCLKSSTEEIRKVAFENIANSPHQKEILGKEVVEGLMEDPSPMVQIAVYDYYITQFIPDQSKGDYLREVLLSNRHRDVRFHILQHFAKWIATSEGIALYKHLAINDEYWAIRNLGVQLIPEPIESETDVPQLLLTIVDNEPINTIRKTAMEKLAEPPFRTPDVKERFERLAVHDSDYYIRRTAVELLVKHFGTDASVRAFALARASQDPDGQVRSALTKRLSAREEAELKQREPRLK